MIPVTIRRVQVHGLNTLLSISKKTFFDAFYHLNNPADMEAYAAKYFTLEQLQKEFDNPGSEFYFAILAGEIVGYIKLNYHKAQTDFQDSKALEIERIYVIAGYQRIGTGQQLIDFAVKTALAKQLEYIWLGVWEKNDRAIRFYERHWFELFGSHDFMLGNDKQTDVLMRLPLQT